MQLQIDFPGIKVADSTEFKNGKKNKLHPNDSMFHDWYRFVLSFPPHLVRHYIRKFNIDESQVILDPFCGTGTTIIESKLNRIPAIGIEANPFAHFATAVKTDWSIKGEELETMAREVASEATEKLKSEGIDDAPVLGGNVPKLDLDTIDAHARKLLITNSISPLPLHKTLRLLNTLKRYKDHPCFNHALLALANALVFKISNLKFGPEVGVGKPKLDYPVISSWLGEIGKIARDVASVGENTYPPCSAILGDSRQISKVLDHNSVDVVITSPPYPNEKDYTRTTRLESVILGFINNLEELRKFKKTLIRSNTRGIYKDDEDDKWIANNKNVLRLAEMIERKRIQLEKTSGFEKLYSRVTLQYFGGMAKHLADLRQVLKKGALLAYVVGDQASYFKVMIRTGKLLAEIAQSLGYELAEIELFRTRFATATSSQLREEVVILRWPG
jgi:DNA modification methylase